MKSLWHDEKRQIGRKGWPRLIKSIKATVSAVCSWQTRSRTKSYFYGFSALRPKCQPIARLHLSSRLASSLSSVRVSPFLVKEKRDPKARSRRRVMEMVRGQGSS